MSWQSKVTQALLLLVTIAAAARVVYGLLGPLLPSLLGLLIIAVLSLRVFRGPHAGR